MKSFQKQQGLTFISVLFILGLIAFFALLTFKIAPIYMNHSKVLNALSALEHTPDVQNMTKREIKSSLEKRFNMNYVDDVSFEDVTITQYEDYLKVEIQYEKVEKILGNLSVLVEFDDHFEAGGAKE